MEIYIAKQCNIFSDENLRKKLTTLTHTVVFNNIIVSKQLCVDMHGMWNTKEKERGRGECKI